MTRLKLLLAVLFTAFILNNSIQAQDDPEPYSARAYWLETKNDRYMGLQKKLDAGENISEAESRWYNEYTGYLDRYWDSMDDEEKRKYYEMRGQWDRELNAPLPSEELTPIDSEQESLGKDGTKERYSLLNGLYGALYGFAAISVFELEGAAAISVPFTTAGIALLMPVINKQKYEDMTYNSALLARHGKFAGALNGLALGGIINDFKDAKLPLVLGTASSIAMGEIGFQLGKKKDWSVGRVALYRHYGIVTPITGALLGASTSTSGRAVSLGWLIGAGAGYFIGNSVANRYSYTQGDVWATSTFTALSSLTGVGILIATNQYEDASLIFLVPAVFTLGGSFLSHKLVKGINLTNKQAFWSSTAAGGGALLGLGLAAVVGGDESLYFLLPAAGGIATHLGMLSLFRKENARKRLGVNFKRSRLDFGINPQNIFMNNLMSERISPELINADPRVSHTASVFDFSLRF